MSSTPSCIFFNAPYSHKSISSCAKNGRSRLETAVSQKTQLLASRSSNSSRKRSCLLFLAPFVTSRLLCLAACRRLSRPTAPRMPPPTTVTNASGITSFLKESNPCTLACASLRPETRPSDSKPSRSLVPPVAPENWATFSSFSLTSFAI